MSALIQNETEAIVGLLIAAASADGTELRAEHQTLTLKLESLAPRVRADATTLLSVGPRLREALAAQGVDAFLDACVARLPADLLMPALRCVADVVGADGGVAEEERAFLEDVAKRMGLTSEDVEKAVSRAP